MAKPKKKCPPARTREMKISFSEDHFEHLTREAKAARLPRAEYVRQLTLDNRPVIHQEVVFNNPEISEDLQQPWSLWRQSESACKALEPGRRT